MRKSCFIAVVAGFCVVALTSGISFATVPMRHILLSTNDLANKGLSPVEGEILYDLVTGCLSARINGKDFLLPTSSANWNEVSEQAMALDSNVSPRAIPRTALLRETQITAPSEGEIAHDTALNRIVIWRAAEWRSLGQRNVTASTDTPISVAGRPYRHVLPNISDIAIQEGEMAADFTNETVWFMSGGVLKDLRIPQ